MFGLQRKTEPLKDEKRMISDHDIVSEIIDKKEAKQNLSEDEYRVFYEKYLEFSKSNEKYPAYNKQYRERCFSIAHSFEVDGVPFNYICGKNKEIFELLKNEIESFEDEASNLILDFSKTIDDIAEDNDLNIDLVRIYAFAVMYHSFSFLNQEYGFSCKTERLPYLFKIAERLFLLYLYDSYYEEGNSWLADEIDEAKTDMYEVFINIIEKNDVTEYCIDEYGEAFMEFIGAEDDATNYPKLNKAMRNWSFNAYIYKMKRDNSLTN